MLTEHTSVWEIPEFCNFIQNSATIAEFRNQEKQKVAEFCNFYWYQDMFWKPAAENGDRQVKKAIF